MATKDISDVQVLQAYAEASRLYAANPTLFRWPEALLQERTGQCKKVCFSAMDRAHRRGLTEYGVSLRAGWITDAGEALLASTKPEPAA